MFYCKSRCDKLCATAQKQGAYKLHNYCAVCSKFFLKKELRCPCCNVQLRTKRVNKNLRRVKIDV